MKYLLDFLSSVPDAPVVQQPDFQQLLVDVQAGKSQAKANDQFYENLERIVNELRITPEASAFLKPVSKKEAPDYYEVVKHPMDLSNVSRNIKNHKYKNKAEFQVDLDLIWENCLLYNALETHPLRQAARFMKQKADHHVQYLQDRVDRGAASMLLQIPGLTGSAALSSALGASTSSRGSGGRGVGRASSNLPGGDEDAAGESEDGEADEMMGYGLGSAANDASRAGQPSLLVPVFRDDRPNLVPNLDAYPALNRTANPMTPSNLLLPDQAGPSYSDKGKGRESVSPYPPPAWLPVEDDASRQSAGWWTAIGSDEAYTSTMPSGLSMAPFEAPRRKRIPTRAKRKELKSDGHESGQANGNHLAKDHVRALRTVSLESKIHSTVDELNTARHIAAAIQDLPRIESEGGVIPRLEFFQREAARRKEADKERKRKWAEELSEGRKRRKTGGEVGEKEAALHFKKATAGMLAHAGFDGANELALDLFTRVATEHLRNVGRTFRTLLDGFAHKMSAEEIILHALFENNLERPQHLEAHIKDEIEKEAVRVSDMTRRVGLAYKEAITAPAIEDDQMFANGGEMMTDGNFADELGEDFLGLRDLGIAQEEGLTSLTIPSNLFYGRRKRAADASTADKAEALDYAPPPPLIPLNTSTYESHLPALLHAFFAARLEAGLGLEDDPAFEAPYNQIGTLGQILSKSAVSTAAGAGAKKKVVNGSGGIKGDKGAGEGDDGKKGPKKTSLPGVGRGNWARPPKDKDAGKRMPEKSRLSAQPVNGAVVGEEEDAQGEEEDAEGEEE